MAKIRVYKDEADGDEFPRMCVKCGADADLDVRQKFSWYPQWVIVIVLASPLIALIVAMILTKRMTVTLPVCHRHRNHWLNRQLFVWLGLLFWVVYLIAAIAVADQLPKDTTPVLIGTGIFGFLGWLVAAVVFHNSGVKPREITDKYIELIKVNPAFADEWDETHPPPKPLRRRPPPRRYEDDEYDDRPRRQGADDRYDDVADEPRPRRKPRDEYDDEYDDR